VVHTSSRSTLINRSAVALSPSRGYGPSTILGRQAEAHIFLSGMTSSSCTLPKPFASQEIFNSFFLTNQAHSGPPGKAPRPVRKQWSSTFSFSRAKALLDVVFVAVNGMGPLCRD